MSLNNGIVYYRNIDEIRRKEGKNLDFKFLCAPQPHIKTKEYKILARFGKQGLEFVEIEISLMNLRIGILTSTVNALWST